MEFAVDVDTPTGVDINRPCLGSHIASISWVHLPCHIEDTINLTADPLTFKMFLLHLLQCSLSHCSSSAEHPIVSCSSHFYQLGISAMVSAVKHN